MTHRYRSLRRYNSLHDNMILLIAIVVITQSFGIQGELDIVLEDVNCPLYNEEYFTEPEVFVNDQNAMVTNFKIIKPLPKEAQGTMNLVLEDAMCPVYDEKYFMEPETYVNDENAWVVNMTLIKPLSIETQGYFSLTGASMGEYVVNTGIDVQMNFCDFIEEPIIMGRVLQGFGLSVDHCPPDVGSYGTEGYIFPTDTLPDEFPPNKYMVEFGILYEEKPLIIYQVFFNSQ